MRSIDDIRRDHKASLVRAIRELRFDKRAQMHAIHRHVVMAGRTFAVFSVIRGDLYMWCAE